MLKVKQSQIQVMTSERYMNFTLTLYHDEVYDTILLKARTIESILQMWCIDIFHDDSHSELRRELDTYYISTDKTDEYLDGYFNYKVLHLLEFHYGHCTTIPRVLKAINRMIDDYYHNQTLNEMSALYDRIDSLEEQVKGLDAKLDSIARQNSLILSKLSHNTHTDL